jgi:hypothetical protein
MAVLDCVDFALACYRQPLAYQERLTLMAPLPERMDRLLSLANGSPEATEMAALLTGARPQELKDAARFCVQQLCFARGAGSYRVLGLEPGAAPERIKEHHRLLMRLFHPDRAAGRETWTESYATRVNEAWTVLSRAPSPFTSNIQTPQSMLTLDGFSTAPSPFADVIDLPLPPPPVFEDPTRRRMKPPRQWLPRQWLPGLVLGGLALATTVVLWGLYLERSATRQAHQATVDPSGNGAFSPPDRATATPEATTGRSATAAFLAAPDWQRLEQREQQARQQAQQAQQAQQQLAQNHREQIAVEEQMLEQMRVERAQLEEQLKTEQARVQQVRAERVAVEQQRLDRLKADQERLEQAKTERLAAERRRVEELQAEQAKAERLAEELRTERRRLEQARIEQARIERAKAESARAEPISLADPQEAERARAERLRLETQMQAERTKVEQAKAERVRLESQLQAERAKAEQVRLNVAGADVPALTARELDELIGRYTRAYERSDLGGIMTLFAADAQMNRSRIRQDYSALLATHQIRQLQLRGLRWAYQGEVASGSGRYQLRLQRRTDGEPAEVEGNIRFRVRKQDRQVLIEAIDYDWPTN